MSKRFKRFHHETINLLTEPSQNNSKEWFDSNRDRYQKYIMEPSREFVVEIGERPEVTSPKINAIPTVNKSLFKIVKSYSTGFNIYNNV